MVSRLIDQYPTTFAVYEMHIYDDYPSAWANQREAFYGYSGDGLFFYDGLWDAWPIETYETKLNQRQAVPTDVTIDLTGVESGSQTYDVTGHVCVEPDGIGKTMRIYMVHALDHWPASPTYERNTIRQGATTEDVAVPSGACVDITRTFVFDDISWAQQDDIKIVAWAQTPATLYPAEVHQAKVMSWPFTLPAELFSDGFEHGDTSAWSSTTP